MKSKYFWPVLFLIVIVGLFLRLRNLASTPLPGQSQDEYSNAWVGLSLIQIGMPVGMSGVTGNLHRERIYINPDRIFQQTAAGDPMTIAYPWFDHPPLVGLISGGYTYLKGARVFEDVTAAMVRKPAVVFAAITITLIGLLGSAWFSRAVGLLAAFFYSISPLTTITNKMVQAENFLTPLALFALYAWWKFSARKKKVWWYLGTVAIMAAVLMKLSSFAFVIAGMLLMVPTSAKKWPWVMIGVFGLAAFSWFLIFGLALSPSAFLAVLFSNSGRAYGMGFSAVSDLFTTVKVTGTKTLSDGMITASMLAFLMFLFGKAKNKEWVVIPFFAYLAVYLFFGGESYGWYRIPFFPFTFLSLAYVTLELFQAAEVGGAMLFLIPLGISLSKLTGAAGLPLFVWRVLPIGIVAIGYFFSNKWVKRSLFGIVILAAVLVTIRYNLKIDANFWYQLN